MKIPELSSKNRTSHRYWTGVAAASLLALALAGCGGSGGGGTTTAAAPAAGGGGAAAGVGAPAGTAVLTAAAANPAATNTAANPAQAFGLITGVGASAVTINSPPKINFTVIDSTGKFVSGLSLLSKAVMDATATATSATDARTKAAAVDANCSGSNVTFAMSKWTGTYWQSLVSLQRLAANTATQFAVVEGTTDPKPTLGGQTVTKADGTKVTGTFIRNADDAAAITDPTKRVVGVMQENTAGGYYTYYFATDVVTPLTIASAVDVQSVTQGKVANNGNVVVKDAKTIYRIGAQLCYTDPATNAKTVVNPVMDFTVNADGTTTPVTAADGKTLALSRQVVSKDSCNECHQNLAMHGTRVEPAYCVNCHNPGSTDWATNNPIDLRILVHRIHFGTGLTKDFKVQSLAIRATDASGNVTGTGYPQDIRNCTKCHDNSASAAHPTAQGDNWMNNPSRAACGSCHDGIDFSTGKGLTLADAAKGLTTSTYGHVGGIQTDDTKCALCHGPTAIPAYHIAATPPNPAAVLFTGGTNSNTNSGWVAGNQNNLPAGAIKVSYDIKSVSVNASRNPVIVFRILQNGARADFNSYSATGKTELWDNFMGGPSLYWVFAVPQDGITAPADLNASISVSLRQLWNGSASGNSAGTLSAPDGSGYYTATVTGSQIPTTAVMVTGGVGYSYSLPSATAAATGGTMPLTQTNLVDYPITKSPVNASFNTGGLIVVAQDQKMVASGYSGRRAIVDDAKCDKCHMQLGPFTEEAFHAGQRNDGPTCSWCHNPNRTSSGWSAGSNNFIHAIHGGQKRTTMFTWHAASTVDGFWNIKMPASLSMPNSGNNVLRNCETCHVPGMFDYSNSATTGAYPNMLWNTVGQGTYAAATASYTMNNKVSSTTATTGLTCGLGTTTNGDATGLAAFAFSPYITQSTSAAVVDYGPGFIFNASASNPSNGCDPSSTTSSTISGTTATTTVNPMAPPGTYTAYSVAAQGSREADGTTLVVSPFTAQCVSCHDGKNRTGTMSDVKNHMTQNGGAFYQPRSAFYKTGTTTLNNSESCLACHGPTGVAAIAAMHKK